MEKALGNGRVHALVSGQGALAGGRAHGRGPEPRVPADLVRGNTHPAPDRPETLNGCGVIIFNAPHTVPERVEALLPVLKGAMSLYDTACGWEVPGS